MPLLSDAQLVEPAVPARMEARPMLVAARLLVHPLRRPRALVRLRAQCLARLREPQVVLLAVQS